MEFVFFRVNGQPYGMKIDYLEGIEELEHVTPFANAPEHIIGISNVRGEVVPIFDVASKFAVAGDKSSKSYLLVRIDGEPICLKVDSVEGMKRYADDLVHAVPSVLDDDNTGYFTNVIKVSADELALVIEPRQMISKEEQKDISDFMAGM